MRSPTCLAFNQTTLHVFVTVIFDASECSGTTAVLGNAILDMSGCADAVPFGYNKALTILVVKALGYPNGKDRMVNEEQSVGSWYPKKRVGIPN